MVRVFKVFVPTGTLILLFAEAFAVGACYAAAGYLVYSTPDLQYFYMQENGLARMLLLVLLVLSGLFLSNLYGDVRVEHRMLLLQQLSMVFGLCFLSQAMFDYINPHLILPRWMMICGSLFSMAAIFAIRVVFTQATRNAYGFQRFLFVGLTPAAAQLARHFASRPDLGLVPVGYLDSSDISADAPEGLVRLGTTDDLDEVVQQEIPNCLALSTQDAKAISTERLLDYRFGGLMVEDIPHLYEVAFGRVCLSELPLQELVIQREELPQSRAMPLISAAAALFLLILTVPLSLTVVLTILFTTGGPVFEKRRRIGFNQQPFDMIDFRLQGKLPAVAGWLQRSRIRFLPRLLNIIRGEMAFVGPRPERPEYVAALQQQLPFYSQRHSVLPGLASWAALNAEADGTAVEPETKNTLSMLEYDLYYVKHSSVALDTYILLHSLKPLLTSSPRFSDSKS